MPAGRPRTAPCTLRPTPHWPYPGQHVPRLTSPTGSSSAYITRRSWLHNTSFFRDGMVVWHDIVAELVLFAAARAAVRRASPQLRVWSCGCSSGEELFSARMVFATWVAPSFGAVAPVWSGLGTDRDDSILSTAQDVDCSWSVAALADAPAEMVEGHMTALPAEAPADPLGRISGGEEWTKPPPPRYQLPARSRAGCHFAREDTAAKGACQDLAAGASGFDVVFCRYALFLYCEDAAARVALGNIVRRMRPGGCLVLGVTDSLPQGAAADCGLRSLEGAPNVWQLAEVATPGEGKGQARLASCASVGAALDAAQTLSEFRVLQGLPVRFAAGPAPRANPACASERSRQILCAKGGVYNEPLEKRSTELERRRCARIAQLRQAQHAAEEEELARARERLRAQRALTRAAAGGAARDARPFVVRQLQDAQAREQRLEELRKNFLAEQPHKSRRPKTAQQRSKRRTVASSVCPSA